MLTGLFGISLDGRGLTTFYVMTHRTTTNSIRPSLLLGTSLLIGKAKLLFRHIFNRETRCNWLKSNQMLKVDRRVRTLSLVTMDNNAMEKTSN